MNEVFSTPAPHVLVHEWAESNKLAATAPDLARARRDRRCHETATGGRSSLLDDMKDLHKEEAALPSSFVARQDLQQWQQLGQERGRRE